jgi:hypothetical protein
MNHFQYAQKLARDAAPKGWVLKVHKYCNGVRCYVRRAPVDLLSNLKSHGLNLGEAMHFEANNLYPFKHYLDGGLGVAMEGIYDAVLYSMPLDTNVWLGIGASNDPFLHVVKPPKLLHPKVQAYADHAKKQALYAKIVAEDLKALEAKQLVPAFRKKLLKMAHHSWA